ncbi:MAG: VanZ family protein [Symbiobacteriia bacterium]
METNSVRGRWLRSPWIRWLPVMLWCALIFYATSSPAYTGEHTGQVVDEALPAVNHATTALVNVLVRKTTHVLAFGLLAGLTWWAMLPGRTVAAAATGHGGAAHGGTAVRRAAWAWGFATLYAASDEFHQLFAPGRTGELRDVLLDSVAALFVVTLLTVAARRRAQKS